MEKEKENAKNDFINMIQNSWIYNKLTENEKENLKDIFDNIITDNVLKGTYKQRYEIMQAIYYSFLKALNYNPINWREEEIPLF